MNILRKKEVSKRVGLSPVTIWRLEKEGKFPNRVQLGRRCVGWKQEDIQQWIDSRPPVKQDSNKVGRNGL
jgi:prophage regulatory protein